ncbi:MAG: translation initiation factor IF-2 [Opitutales bacterium]|nr:translation initiation factor IF-2 [Opitutales bacterium]
MAVRVYQLSKEIGMENSDLIALLRDRGHEVKSASSTIDNISAEALREEFAEAAQQEAAPEEAAPAAEPVAPAEPEDTGAVIRSKEDVERERREREEAEKAKNAPKAVIPPSPDAFRKSAPPLPKGPPVMIRPNFPASLTTRPQPKPAEPTAPTVRADIPPVAPPPSKKDEPTPASSIKAPPLTPPPSKVAPPTGPAPAVPPTAPASKPAPLAPPPARGPKPLAPPKISAPRPLIPPSASTPVPPAEGDATEGAEAAPAPGLRPLTVKTPIVVRDFAVQIGRKPFQLISELMELGIFASMNTAIDEEVAARIARNHGIELEIRHRGEGSGPAKEEEVAVDESALLEPRAPVVCILGHVDHGKTTLLDTIRQANVVAGEAGGITQHVGAYQIEFNGQKITFIDTPGHAAFSNMRARGASLTDIAVLVVAADDGFMPQTDEALRHARTAKVPVVVAINKVDAPGANIDRVKRQMQERDLAPEDWGGETLFAPISALKKEGIDKLLEAILLQAEVTEGIEANPKADPEGVLLEAQKEIGRGSTASAIITRGTLKPGMALVCGENWCRVRQILDDAGKPIKAAIPGTPVKIVGWSGPPDAGDSFRTVKNDREAKRLAEDAERSRKQLEAAQKVEGAGVASIEDLFAAIAKTHKKTFRAVVKADVYGTAEALANSLQTIKSDKINIDVVDVGVGVVTRNDITMASASGACVVAFNVGLDNGVNALAKHHSIQIISHNIIYEIINQVKDAMSDLLEPELRENKIGGAEVRAIFPLAKGFVAGCMVTEGRIQRNALARLLRKGKLIHESKILTLRRFKDDATEVRAGYECGIQIDGFNGYEEGDAIEVFEILKIKPSL